jgi:hypothetical protein
MYGIPCDSHVSVGGHRKERLRRVNEAVAPRRVPLGALGFMPQHALDHLRGRTNRGCMPYGSGYQPHRAHASWWAATCTPFVHGDYDRQVCSRGVDPGYILATGAAGRCYHSKMAPSRMTAPCWCAMGGRGVREEKKRLQKDLEKADAEGMRPGRT